RSDVVPGAVACSAHRESGHFSHPACLKLPFELCYRVPISASIGRCFRYNPSNWSPVQASGDDDFSLRACVHLGATSFQDVNYLRWPWRQIVLVSHPLITSESLVPITS